MIYTIFHRQIALADKHMYDTCGMPWYALGSRIMKNKEKVMHHFPGLLVFKTVEEAENLISLRWSESQFNVWMLDTTWDNTFVHKDGSNRLLNDCKIIGELI